MSTPRSNAVLLYGRWEKPRSTGLFGMTWGATIFAGAVLIVGVLQFMIFRSLFLTAAILGIGLALLVPMLATVRWASASILLRRPEMLARSSTTCAPIRAIKRPSEVPPVVNSCGLISL